MTTADLRSLTVTSPDNYIGALALAVTASWTGSDGSALATIINDKVEVFQPNAQDPIAVSNDAAINGSATLRQREPHLRVDAGCWRKAGSAMLDQRIDLSYDFQASFDVYLGSNANGADGLAFVLQNDPLGAHALGGNGGNYGAIGIKNGLGIAFDTWQNAELGDMAADHTDLFKTGVPSAISRISDQIPIGNGNVTDGQWHNVLVSWNATDHTLNYWFDGQLVGSAQPGHRRQLSGRFAICLSRIYRWNRRRPQSAGGASQFPDRLVRRPVA